MFYFGTDGKPEHPSGRSAVNGVSGFVGRAGIASGVLLYVLGIAALEGSVGIAALVCCGGGDIPDIERLPYIAVGKPAG